jgi:hypothetical protein
MRDGDLREQILGLEAQIEELAETIESCRKIIQISKAFIVVGGLLIAAITIGLIRFDPMLMIGALTAVVGGIVALGSNWSTSQQAVSTLKAAEAQRAETTDPYDSTDSCTVGYQQIALHRTRTCRLLAPPCVSAPSARSRCERPRPPHGSSRSRAEGAPCGSRDHCWCG